MTTCDILLAHLCPLNNSSSLSPHIPLSFLLSSSPSFSLFLSPSFSPCPCFTPRFLSHFTLRSVHGLGSLLRSSRQGNRKRRGNGIRRISASIKQELRDRPRRIYLLAQSAFISARVTRAVCYLPHRDTYGREYEKSVRELDPLVSCFAPANQQESRKSERANARLVNARGGKLASRHESVTFR